MFPSDFTKLSKNDKKYLQNDMQRGILQASRTMGENLAAIRNRSGTQSGGIQMKFTWSDQKSIILTRAVVAGTIAGCGIMTVSGPWLTRWMVSAHALPPASGPVLLGMGYVCAVLAFVMLISLYKFLRRIEADAVFVPANVTALRRISWCCTGAAALCLAGGCGAGAAVHLCHWRCGGVYGADRAGHQKCVCPGR